MLITRIAAITALVLGLAACSSDGSSHATGLRTAMGKVPADDAARLDFQYGDLAAMRKLGLIKAHGEPAYDQRWITLAGYGSGQLAPAALGLPETLGLNLFAADSAITVGAVLLIYDELRRVRGTR